MDLHRSRPRAAQTTLSRLRSCPDYFFFLSLFHRSIRSKPLSSSKRVLTYTDPFIFLGPDHDHTSSSMRKDTAKRNQTRPSVFTPQYTPIGTNHRKRGHTCCLKTIPYAQMGYTKRQTLEGQPIFLHAPRHPECNVSTFFFTGNADKQRLLSRTYQCIVVVSSTIK